MKLINIENYIISTAQTKEAAKNELLSDMESQVFFEFEDSESTAFKAYPSRFERDDDNKIVKVKDVLFPVVKGEIIDHTDKRSIILKGAMLKFHNITFMITIALFAGILLWTGYRAISLNSVLPEALLFMFLCFWIPFFIKRTHKKQVMKYYKEIEKIIVK